jgi:hypothetical protein
MEQSKGKRLERYTLRCPDRVLLVSIVCAGEEDCITIFKGFSSSLMRSTAFDPDVPVIDENAEIIEVDLLASPYDPDNPQYLERGLTWADIEQKLEELGL